MSITPTPTFSPSFPHPHYLALLPIEVNQSQFKQMMHLCFKKGLHLTALLSNVYNMLIQAKETALQLSDQGLKETGAIHYISTVQSLKTITIWLEYLIEVYKETYKLVDLSQSDKEQLIPLQQLEKEVTILLDQWLPTLIEHRKQTALHLRAILKQSIQTMQKKTEDVAKKVALTYQLVSAGRYARAQQLIICFFADFLNRSDQIVDFIEKHLEEWTRLSLQEGRDLFIKDPEGLPCSFLFSTEGNCYILIEAVEHLLGKGSDKIVFRSISLPKGEIKAIIKPVATKTLISSAKQKTHQINQLFNMWTESELLLKLRKNPGVIQLEERMVFEIDEKKQLFLVEDYYWDGTLHDYFNYTVKISNDQGRLSIHKCHSIMRQLLEGLASIHQAGILHHDIKPDNILLDDSEEEIRAAIADFQLAAYERDKIRLDYLRCRAAWASPEYARLQIDATRKKRYSTISTQALDVWSLGIVFYILLTHSTPYWHKIPPSLKASTLSKQQVPFPEEETQEKPTPHAENKDPADLVDTNENEELLSQTDAKEQKMFEAIAALPPNWLPEEFRHTPYFPLLEKMLDVNPETRCSATEALNMVKNGANSGD